MPEGHSVHRIAKQFAVNFVGHPVAVSSPQGRFTDDAARIDGRTMVVAKAVGKQMFLEFDNRLWLRIHLGIYGAWDFAGAISIDPTIASANGRMGQTAHRGTIFDEAGENSVHSIGAPRRTRLRMSESERVKADIDDFPPEPIGQVRMRLLTDAAVADLRGPMVCELLDPTEVDAVIAKLGPDPQLDDGPEAEEAFVAKVRTKATAIALLLMDQSVVSGIGNVYRAELLFRERQNPHTPGRLVAEETVRALWRDWVYLLRIGVETGQMMTMDDLNEEAYRQAMANREDRHWVYKREGLPCRVCGTHILMEELGGRKLYWCPKDQE